VVNYNGEKYLEESLQSVFARREAFAEVLLIDNASEDRSVEIVRDLFPAVKVIQLEENHGPGAARNAGFRSAACDRILFMDNDVSLAPDCPDMLVQALNENPRAGVAMPRVLYAHKKDTIQYDGAENHFLGLMTLHNVDLPVTEAKHDLIEIGSVVTACFLMDRARWGDREPFDETFFFNYEDHDFGLRTRILGHQILSVPPACCFHREGTEGLSRREGGAYSRIRIYCLIRNRWQLVLKNYALRTLFILSPVLLTYEIFQFAGVLRKKWYWEWCKALLWIAVHLPGILKKRKIVQRARRTPDREILHAGVIPFTADLAKTSMERTGKQVLDYLTNAYWKQTGRFI
jgi:GT2 family glycosyltransferase